MSDKINASQAAQRLARANKIDLGELTGTGNGGQVTKKDVEGFLEARKAPGENPPNNAPAAENPEPGVAEGGTAPSDEGGAAGAAPDAAEPAKEKAAEVADEKGDTLPITKLRDDPAGGTWWCPFDDYSQPLEHYSCGGCGAKRSGGPLAELGDKVSAP